jgi:hypothetical protein
MLKRLLVAGFALALFVMPSSVRAVDLVSCEGCQSPPPPTTNCGGSLQEDRAGGGLSRWSANYTERDTYYDFTYSLTDPGTWTLNFHYDIYDNRGVRVGTGVDIPVAQITVPPGSVFNGEGNGDISDLVPFGGTVIMTVTGYSDFGSFFNGWGQSDNLGCQIIF